MRLSQYFLTTYRETPADAEIASHQLMLRAGMIQKLASGLYSWLPLGLRVLNKIAQIVREEMNRAGALEVLLPAVQPAELWQETDRWETFGPLLLKMKDHNKRDYCFGPTHEEVITDLVRHEVSSYKQLPLALYQIQTKFRDEIRPRFGVMRAREFIMKDAYSFHLDDESLTEGYNKMYDAYCRIFDRLGLKYRAVLADTGSIGGSQSHEFQVLADSGEDLIFYSDSSQYAANIELAAAIPPSQPRPAPEGTMTMIETPTQKTINHLCEFLGIEPQQTIKTLVVEGSHPDVPLVALVLRGDHELNTAKAEKLPEVASPLTLASEANIAKILGCEPGFLGPVGLNIPVIVDHSAAVLADFICGANQQGHHYRNVNWQRDVELKQVADLRNVVVGDPSPDGQGTLKVCRGIEVGHVFQLGDKYSRAMKAAVTNKDGQQVVMKMGCYGIGVSRIAAAAIEQNHDENGIIWPESMAPFHIAIIPINLDKSPRVREAAEKLYKELTDIGYEVLLDDRGERAGIMFADMDLIGIPHRLVISERGLDAGMIEYKHRRNKESQTIKQTDIVSFLVNSTTHK